MAPRPRVLLVDDYPPNRLAAERVLEDGYDVAHATSGAEALELCEREDFALILLDVRMPGLSGYETSAELRRRERTRDTPIVLSSAIDGDASDILRGFAAGATDFILSPWDPDFLRAKVDTYVRLRMRELGLKEQVERLAKIYADLRKDLGLKADPGVLARLGSLERTLVELGVGSEKLRSGNPPSTPT